MALLGKNKTLAGIFDRGFVRDAVDGIGIGTLINVGDKRFIGGRLTNAGVNVGQTLNGKALSLNVTDLLTALATRGITLSGRGLFQLIAVVGTKKVFEAFDYIDPHEVISTHDGTNVTQGRLRQELARLKAMQADQDQAIAAAQVSSRPAAYQTSTFGGVN